MSKKRILIIGCSRLGKTIAELHSSSDDAVLVIDKDPRALEKLSPSMFSGKTFIGDAIDYNVLLEKQVSSFDEVLILTDDDNINIYLSLIIDSEFNPRSITTTLHDADKKILFEGTKIQIISLYDLALDSYLKTEQKE